MLRWSEVDHEPQAMYIIRVIQKWFDDDKITKMKHVTGVGGGLDDSMSSLEGSWGERGVHD